MEEDSVKPVLAKIRQGWDWVRPVIEDQLLENADVDAVPEDVYAAWKTGTASLWLVPDGMFSTGFEYGE